jgi:hypothetical protein
MGNSTFGVDPAPGVVKSLRILARDGRGRERTFEYREGSTVDGSMFAGWGGRPGWGGGGDDADAGQYRIVRAEYGAGNSWVDVTRRLREIASTDATFRMGNSTFDVDPAPGTVKMLRILGRTPRGRERTFEYREGSTVDGAMFSGWSGGDWGGGGSYGGGYGGGYGDDADAGQYRIVRAEYGADNRWVDVTRRLREIASTDANFRMGNSTFDADPAPGRVKTLRILARGPRGGTRTFEYREGSTVDGALFSGWSRGDWGDGDRDDWHDRDADRDHDRGPDHDRDYDHDRDRQGGQYRIVRAEYGAGNRWVNVTPRLKEIASSNATFRMGNSTFNVDPAPGVVKTLRILAKDPSGRDRAFEYREGSTVDGSVFSGWSRGDWGW